MAKKVRSAKGEMVDFDLLKIKEQIATSPPPQDVRARQDFIEKRLRRRLKRTALPPAPKIEQEKETVAADPKMPATEDLTEEPKKIDEVEEPKKTTTRQKARPKPPTTKE